MKPIRTLIAALLALLILVPQGFAAVVPSSPSAGWFVVGFDRKIRSADRAALDATGAQVAAYRPVNSYVAWLDSASLARTSSLRRVAAVTPIPSRDKIQVEVATAADGALLQVLVHGPQLDGMLAAVSKIARIESSVPATPDAGLYSVFLRTANLAALSARPEVLSIGAAPVRLEPEDEGSDQIVAGNITATKQPIVGYHNWLDAMDLSGAGVTVAVVDTGVSEEHPDLEERVVAAVDYSQAAEPFDTGGHGTHVAGIIGGTGETAGLNATDANGFLHGLGVAPEVGIVNINAIGTTSKGGWPPSYGFQTISKDALTNGAIAWNASWHTVQGNRAGYLPAVQTMDIISRDANWDQDGSEQFTLVFSAGNSAASGPTVPHEAKNIIAVGSTNGHRAGSIDGISSFSSRGPTKDERIFPTVSAPGGSIISTRALPAGQSCNTPPADATTFGLYASCSGTSMAAPHVTGAVALMAEWWKKSNDGAVPSPAMNKALLVNTATDMGGADVPNHNEGWGRINLGALFDPNAQRVYVDQSVTFNDFGDTYGLRVAPVDPSKPMKVTLAWSDAPAEAYAETTLVNDLDLSLTSESGELFWGNVFDGGWSIAGGGPDFLNNLENVYLQNPSGPYTLSIAATNLPGDGVPFAGDTTDQDFALVLSNAVIVP